MQKFADVVFDRRGNVVPGAQVRVQTPAGTDAVIYSENGTAVTGNPLTTDSLGRFSFYAPNGRYNLKVFIGSALWATLNDVLLEDPQDATPEVIDGGIIRNSALENITIDGEPAVTMDMVSGLQEAIIAANAATAAANAAAAAANALGDDLLSTTDPDKGAALMNWLLEYTGTTALRQDLKNAEEVSYAVFGATGIGDDSAAIDKAHAWQLSLRQTYNPTIGGSTGSALVTCPVLTVPNGWRVKAQGNIQPPCFLIGKGRASLESLDNTKDFFVGDDTYKVYIGYLNFLGGKSQVKLQNANINSGTWTIDTCTMEGSNDYALQFLNTSGSYPVTSSQPIIINTNFIRCKRGVKSQADHTFHLGGWLQPEGDFFDPDTCFIWTNGAYSINWVMTIPGGTFPSRARWFDCWGAIRGLQTRFGGEGGGLPIVYWFAVPNRYTVGSAENIDMGVSFHQCSLYAGNAVRPDRGIINCRGQLPPIVRITDSLNGITCPYITNESAGNGGIPDIAAYIANLKTAWNGDNMYNELSYHYTGNKRKITPATVLWPPALDTYTYVDFPYVPRKAKVKTTTTTSTVANGTTSAISLDTVVYDPYGLAAPEAANGAIKAPFGAKFVTCDGYIELATHALNNTMYQAVVYKNNAPIPDSYQDYPKVIGGVCKIKVRATDVCAENNTFTLRIFQNSGGVLTVALATLEARFD